MSDLNITAVNPITRRITFAFQIVPKKTKGIETLLQLCAKTVLTTPGKDIFAPEYGGGILSYLGRNLNIHEIPRIYADVAFIIRKSERQILDEQVLLNMIPDDTLQSLTLLSARYLEEESALDIRALITAESGDSADISLGNQIRFKRGDSKIDINEGLLKLWEELQGQYRTIMEYLYGYRGREILSTTEISTKLSIPEQFVTEIRNRLSIRLKELQR